MSDVAEVLNESRLPDVTIEAVARGFYREADRYGFRPADYVRFMSSLLDIANGRIAVPAPGALSQRITPPIPDVGVGDEQVAIRAFDGVADVDLLRGWLADPAGRHFLPVRAGGALLTLDEIMEDSRSVLGMVTLIDGTPMGVTAFLDFDPVQRKAELRKLIGVPGLRGRGHGKAATRLWLRYGFEVLNLHKIYLSTVDTNVRNIRLNEGLGFKLEGILHDEVLMDGVYHDVLRMAIWRDKVSF
jgi:RimJ/RimL family protein N-acetyltransferase